MSATLLVMAIGAVPMDGQCQERITRGTPYEKTVDSIPGTLVTFEMILVPRGTVTVPSAAGVRSVAVEPFWIARTETTWNAYDAFALAPLESAERRRDVDAVARPTRPYGAPDYGFGHAGFPVISVARGAAEAFCAWLSARTGKRYRLPTEAEWMLAAQLASRGQPLPATTRDSLAWHAGNAAGKTHAVGTKALDASGLHDLFGNAAEWVINDSGKPVVRGGSYRDQPVAVGPDARAEQQEAWNERDPQIPKSRWWLSDGPFVGFRIVREP
jgi:formylglycine-generating enzyme required for sulfatase activity